MKGCLIDSLFYFPELQMNEDRKIKFTRTLKKKHESLRKWASAGGIEAYRVYGRDLGDIPMAIDIYGKYLHVTVFDQKNGVSLSPGESQELTEAAGKALYFPEDRIFLKHREVLTNREQYGRFTSENQIHTIGENGLLFKVNLSDYIDTGLFLDHRDTRQFVRENAAGKRVLNLFCYTGSFSVYAAAGGAESTTSVDLSNVYLQWAKENMEMNSFTAPVHQYINSDVFPFLEVSAREKKTWDLIILDPPTFSNSRKMDRILDIQRDHVELIDKSLSVLSKNGSIIFSTNFRDFRLDEAVRKNGFVNNISDETIPGDFKGSSIHKCWLIGKRK